MLIRLLLLLVLCAPAAAGAAPVIMVLGDSLSAAHGIDQNEGWVFLMQQRLERDGFPHRVANVSISGETTSGGLTRLDAALDRHRPDIVIVELGANDGLRGLPLGGIEQNLAGIITRIQANDAAVLLAGMQLPPNYGPAYTRGFARIFERLAQKHGAALVPFLLEGLDHDNSHFLDDRLHPNAEAQLLILDNIWPALEPLLH
jgi:acyl-CoA thioesterase I